MTAGQLQRERGRTPFPRGEKVTVPSEGAQGSSGRCRLPSGALSGLPGMLRRGTGTAGPSRLPLRRNSPGLRGVCSEGQRNRAVPAVPGAVRPRGSRRGEPCSPGPREAPPELSLARGGNTWSPGSCGEAPPGDPGDLCPAVPAPPRAPAATALPALPSF